MNPAALRRAQEIAAQYRQKLTAKAGPRPRSEKAGDRGALYIYEPIGAGWFGEGLTAKRVADELDALKGAKALDVFINSEGGDVFEAKAIFALLRRFEGEKTVHVDGLAASAATFIAMAGDRIITAPAATWMIHEAATLAYGWAADLRAVADVLDLENRSIAETYAKRTGHTSDECLAWMGEEKWMNAREALDLKFTDAIEGEDAGEEDVSNASGSSLVDLAEQTQRRIAARARIADMEQRTRNRASPDPQRPGQPERGRNT